MKTIIQTANVLRYHNNASSGPRDSQNELLQGFEATLSHGESSSSSADADSRKSTDVVIISDRKTHSATHNVDLDDLTIAVKLFLNTKLEASSVREAANSLLSFLGVSHLDSLVVSMAGTLESETAREDLSEEFIKSFLPVWKEMESLEAAKVVKSIGVSDFNRVQLEQIWPLVQTKPLINQVNIDDCCTIPKDLVTFAKEHNVELLTHSDKPEIVCQASLMEVAKKHNLAATKVDWIVRYSSTLRNRGVVHDKAFVLALDS